MAMAAGSASFEHLLEPAEVGRHGIGVGLKVLVAHARAPPQREHHLTTVVVCDHPHRVRDDFTRGQRDIVVEDTKFIARNEGKASAPFRGLDEPSIVNLLDRAPEPRCPPWQVGRFRGVLVNLTCGAVNPLAEMPGFRGHAATIPDASGIAIVQNGHPAVPAAGVLTYAPGLGCGRCSWAR